MIEDRIGLPVLGVLPMVDLQLPEEDSVALDRKNQAVREGLQVGVVRLPRISNYSDFDPLENESDVNLRYIEKPEQIAGLDLLVLPGTKSTLADLEFLKRQGLFQAIKAFHVAGGRIIGICGGFQLLGEMISDPDQVESTCSEDVGLGLLDIKTILKPGKHTHQVEARFQPAAAAAGFSGIDLVDGYEIHAGETEYGLTCRPLLRLQRRSNEDVCLDDGAVSADGRVWGTYLHGVFAADQVRCAVLAPLRAQRGAVLTEPTTGVDLNDELDKLADHLETHLDLEQICSWLQLSENGK